MAVERRKYTEEFKREALRLMESSGKPISQITRDLGVNDNNLYRWRGLYGSQRQLATNGSLAEMEAEVKWLRREVEVLRAERDILKKAMEIVLAMMRKLFNPIYGVLKSGRRLISFTWLIRPPSLGFSDGICTPPIL